MEAECEGYLDPLSFDLLDGMGIAISHWDNSDSRADFEFADAPTPAATCDGSWLFSEINISTWDSNEENEEAEPEKFQSLLGNIDWNDTASDGTNVLDVR